MMNRVISRFKYLFVLSLILFAPTVSMAGLPFGGYSDRIDQTDQATDRLVVFWDMRMARQTFVQVTNYSNGPATVHVQIFNVTSPATVCEETDFNDRYTPGDTHVYDLGNLVSNNDADGLGGVGFSAPNADLDEGYGLFVVSEVNSSNILIGMFRIIDGDGDYEYRTNAAGQEDFGFLSNNFWSIADLNFNNVDGSNLSDVVGLVYRHIDSSSVLASPLIQATFGDATGDVTEDIPQIHIFDEFESPTSCSPTTFSCAPTQLDKGIDNFHPNSKGEVNRICNDSVDVGWLFMPLNRFNCFDINFGGIPGDCFPVILGGDDEYFVGYLGLNNGDGTGSMDSWWTPGSSDDTGIALP